MTCLARAGAACRSSGCIHRCFSGPLGRTRREVGPPPECADVESRPRSRPRLRRRTAR
jgi:hypothetical protein